MSEMSDSIMVGQPEHKDGRKGAIAQLRQQGNFAKGARGRLGAIPMGLWVWVDWQLGRGREVAILLFS